MRNKVNRRTILNLRIFQKQWKAASHQVRAIEHIDKHIGLMELPKPLYDVALLRRENPDLSLSDLV